MRFWSGCVPYVLLPLLFVATCVSLGAPAMRIADPMTNIPVRAFTGLPFPVLVMVRGTPRIELRDSPKSFPLPPGSSFLVPPGRELFIEDDLNAHHKLNDRGKWVLRVHHVATDIEDIEFYWMRDGYLGSVYRATPTAIAMRYRKFTGPGFGIIAAGIAALINSVAWLIAIVSIRMYRGYRRTAKP